MPTGSPATPVITSSSFLSFQLILSINTIKPVGKTALMAKFYDPKEMVAGRFL
jgi:hypothetical protein